MPLRLPRFLAMSNARVFIAFNMKFLAIALTALFSLAAPVALASEAVLTAEVSVDVSAKDGVDARELAMAEAQVKGLDDVLSKLAPPSQVKEIIEGLEPGAIAGMIRSTEMLDEKISPDRYRATLRLSFNAEAVSALVADANAPKTETADPETHSFLIIPAYDDSGTLLLWDDKNPWRNVWKSLALEINTGDVIVPYGDNADAGIVNEKTMASANYASLTPLAVRYGVTDIVILQATYSKNPDMKLSIIKRRVNRQMNEVNLLSYRGDLQETRDLLLARAARDVAESLLIKKTEELTEVKAVQGGDRNQVMVLANITTLQSWTDLRNRLKTLPMIDKIDTLAVSPQQVDMIIYYRGVPTSLARAIEGLKLRLAQNEKYWVISRD